MEKEDLRKILNQPYRTENWKRIADFVFPNVSYLQTPQNIPFQSEKVEAFKQIGNVRLNDGKNLAMFEVRVSPNVNLIRNRVELRNIVAPLIDQEKNHGVLVIYEQGKEDYRFTFTAKSSQFDEEESDFVSVETDTKRFTYVLGKNESCRTAANRFWELGEAKDRATIKDIETAFSVERLNDEFFSKYKKFYEDFVEYITGKRFVEIKGKKGKYEEKVIHKPHTLHKKVFEKNDKLARNFVKLLLGRLVFIQFLQKKGWMGVDAFSKKWENGDKNFLLTHFTNPKFRKEYHSKFLYHLFYKAFNTPNRENDVFKLTNSRIPYLNGGLFENEYPNSELIDFPEEYFDKLLDFFTQYNFTIDENDLNDHEVGIDPEMLGHIFENLLEDNKDKGAFYTPKSIVQFMCQESLIQYLKTYLIEKKVWKEESEEALTKFVRKKLAADVVNDYDEHLAIALRDVKICDPAIGSGAFPMGLLYEIFHCIHKLYDVSVDVVGDIWGMKEWEPDKVKKNIIQHSIYGVDIDKGAVDIARLRFWLSLIVDESIPTPLPNLDFKIMQGNSLLESYEGIDLSIPGQTKTANVELDLFGNPLNAQLKITDTEIIEMSNIQELVERYFNLQQPIEKQKLKREIEVIIHRHIDFNLEFEENKLQLLVCNLQLKIKGNKALKTDTKGRQTQKTKNLAKLKIELEERERELKNLQRKREELHSLQNKSERPYFLWHLFFKDVFDKGGFNIVIGNPPWGGAIDSQLKYLKAIYPETTTEHTDSFKIFIDKGLRITAEQGCFVMIIPNTLLRQTRIKDVRKLILKKEILTIINLGENVFEQVVAPSCIISLRNYLAKSNHIVNYFDISKLSNVRRNAELLHLTNNQLIPQKVFETNFENAFVAKISESSVPVSPLVDFELFKCKDVGLQCQRKNVGKENRAKSDLAEKVFLTSKIRQSDVMYWKGRDIDKYRIKLDTGRYFRTKYEDLLKKDEVVYMNKAVYETSPKILFRQTADCIVATLDDEGRWFDGSVIGLVPTGESNYSIYYMLGLFNSKYFKWYYQKLVGEGGRVFAQVKLSKVKQLPIRVIDFENPSEKSKHDEIVSLVKKILTLTSKLKFDDNMSDDELEIQAEIDSRVFELYDVKESELKMD